MEVIPAIDLRGGRCVRLFQGDYDKETVFFEDPVEAALHWQSLGAGRIHIVDLDGAASGKPANLDAVLAISAQVSISLQMGGGIRDIETARRIIDLGVQRIIFGTSAVMNPDLVRDACEGLGPDAVIVGIDARYGKATIKGWKETSELSARELIGQMASLGVKRVIYTDILRDGTLTEPNFAEIQDLVSMGKVDIIASGGVSSLGHIVRLKEVGVEGAIVGKAIYTGAVNLEEAIRLAASFDKSS